MSVQEANLSMKRRLGASEDHMLAGQCNLALTYERLGQIETSLRMRREAYAKRSKLLGGEHEITLLEASNYASDLVRLQRLEEAKSLLRKTMPVARRVLGESHQLTLKMSWTCAAAHIKDAGATLDDLRGAVTTLEETSRTARRVLGGAHPEVVGIETSLRYARLVLRAREETQPSPGSG